MSETDIALKFSQASIEAFVAGVDDNPIHQGPRAVVPGFLISAWAKQASDNLVNLCASDERKFAWQRSVLKRPIRADDELLVKIDEFQKQSDAVKVRWGLYVSDALVASSTVIYKRVEAAQAPFGPLTMSFSGHAALRSELCDVPSYCVSLTSKAFANLLKSQIALQNNQAVVFRSQEITAYAALTGVDATTKDSPLRQDYYTVTLSTQLDKAKGGVYAVSAIGAREDRAKLFDVHACLAIVNKERLS